MADLDRSEDFKEVKASKIRLKETNPEKADRLYRKEQRRLARENDRISRANGYAVSPPRRICSESISPPRNPTKRQYDERDEVDGSWMGGYGRRAREELERREWEDKFNWMAGNPEDPFGSSYGFARHMEEINIPRRFRDVFGIGRLGGPGPGPGPGSSSSHRRNAAAEVDILGGPVPPIGTMTDEEYTTWVREGMYRLRHRAEIEAAERIRRDKAEKERLKEVEREKANREEEKRIKRLKKQRGEDEERKKQNERARWRERWKLLGERDGDVVDIDMSFSDIPWPVYRSSHDITQEQLSIDNIRMFISATAEDTAENGKIDLRRTIREAIRNYHPDRFNVRILSRVKEKDKEDVKEAVVRVSGLLNDLAGESR
ncbi:uncharacterized protein IL334_001405 [Kwoniella shivajii]|uniref:J domain-containing protein n=1 Tax=Kwoniella shivajii TaxID=564305 RepID=A0ABZ1CRZ7_9TREE|nr:hypothetical protein IL334_001405 [Kwoniella shivajii]